MSHVEDPIQPRRSKTDRRVKMAFAALALFVIVGLIALRSNPLDSWSSDYQGALEKAAQNDTYVVVFFHSEPLSVHDEGFIKNTLGNKLVQDTLKEANYVKLQLVPSENPELAEKYDVQTTPTFLLLDPQGEVLNREVGQMNDVDFANKVLALPGDSAG
jgi:thioredoxin-related protein